MTTTADIIATGLFDAAWYCEHYPDIVTAGIEPVEHYVRYGQAEGRLPNAYFDQAAYQATVGQTGSLTPLLHLPDISNA